VALVRTDVWEAPGSSETSVLTRATRRNNPEDTILHGHRCENLKSYIIVSDYKFIFINKDWLISDHFFLMALRYHMPIQQSISEWHLMPSSVGRSTSRRNKVKWKWNFEKCTGCSDADPNCQCTISCPYINKCCDQYGHMVSNYGDTYKKTNYIIQQCQNKVLRCLINAPWYACNSNIHWDLGIETVTSIIARYAISHENRLQHHGFSM
jgi:hypothetical protein